MIIQYIAVILICKTTLKDLKFDMHILTWFKVNSMKPNPKKFQFMVLGRSTTQSIILTLII